jgi:hypothetical protein
MRCATNTSHTSLSEMLTTDLPMAHGSMTQCEYFVRAGTLDGPEARIAELGQRLYHTWVCSGRECSKCRPTCEHYISFAASDLRILVKKCTVSNGQGQEFAVIDDNGCAVDAVGRGMCARRLIVCAIHTGDRAKSTL